jgi:hypothetical protein
MRATPRQRSSLPAGVPHRTGREVPLFTKLIMGDLALNGRSKCCLLFSGTKASGTRVAIAELLHWEPKPAAALHQPGSRQKVERTGERSADEEPIAAAGIQGARQVIANPGAMMTTKGGGAHRGRLSQ